MNLCLDDDTADRRLISLLRNAGHRVTVPGDVDLIGTTDARHIIHAIREQQVLITRNHDDFLDLHEVIQASGGRHHGMLIIRSDNDPKRDMTPRGIVTAIGKLEAQGIGRHSRDEIYTIGEEDVVAFGELLADGHYLFGDRPTSFDASAFGVIGNLKDGPFESPVRDRIRNTPNIAGYIDRIRQTYFADLA